MEKTKKRKKIGIVGSMKPEKYTHGNIYYIGKTLAKKYQIDIIGFKKGHHPSMDKLFGFKQYTSIKFKQLNRVKSQNQIKMLIRDLINVYKYCKHEKPDFLLSIQHPHIGGVAITLMGKCFRIPTIVRYSGYIYTEWKYQISSLHRFMAFASRWLNDIIFYSNSIITMNISLAKELTRRGCSKKKINIIPQFTDCNLFYPPKNKLKAKKKLRFEKWEKVILYVPGGIAPKKGAETLVRILPRILKKNPRTFFCIAGTDKWDYGKKLKKIGGDNILLLDRIPPYELADYYRASDILIQLSWYESITRVLMEASASGLYVIARDNEGASEIADATFRKESELIDILLSSKSKCCLKNKLPTNYQWEFLEKRYFDVLKES